MRQLAAAKISARLPGSCRKGFMDFSRSKLGRPDTSDRSNPAGGRPRQGADRRLPPESIPPAPEVERLKLLKSRA
jgi:hypothetical protein